MIIKSERALEIDTYIRTHSEAKLADYPIVIGGDRLPLTAYKLPISLLRYNISNGRFTVEKLQLEKDLGRQLDYSDPDDVAKIRKMLLEKDNKLAEEAEALKNDLKRVGQLEPGVITHDGYVINGNRRMAVLELLHTEDPTGKWQFLDAQRLPPNISSANLWRIEAGLQLSKEKREKYGPMNELLKIKEGKDAGLSNEEIAVAMFEWTSKEVENALERLELIDTFLEYMDEKDRGGYGFIERYRLHEYFEDLQDYVWRPAIKAGLSRKERSKRINCSHGVIWAAAMLMKSEGRKGDRITHWNFREIRQVFEDEQATNILLNHLGKAKNPKALNPNDIRDDFRDARELVSFKKDNQQPRRLIETAIRALRNVDHGISSFFEEPVKEAVRELDAEVARLKKDLGL